MEGAAANTSRRLTKSSQDYMESDWMTSNGEIGVTDDSLHDSNDQWDRLDARASKRINGPSWAGLRRQFRKIHQALLSVSPSARGELTTIYVKYVADEIGNQPYAVVWLKKSTELVVGLALREGYEAAELRPPLPGYKYARLTAFLKITPQDAVPGEFLRWASDAYSQTKGADFG